jgi:hypothetical protein
MPGERLAPSHSTAVSAARAASADGLSQPSIAEGLSGGAAGFRT